MIAIAFGTINIIGGFLVTDRMLEHVQEQADAEAPARTPPHDSLPLASFLQSANFIDVLYIIAFGLFIQGLRGLRARDGRPRQPHRRRRHGRSRSSPRCSTEGEGNWGLIVARRGDRHRRRRSPPRGMVQDDRDAADGRAVQRRRRRRGRA